MKFASPEPGHQEQAEFRKLTGEQQREAGKKEKTTIQKATTLVYRNYRDNPDLRWLAVLVVALVVLGYVVAKVVYGLSTTEIKTEVSDFFTVLIALLISALAAYQKIATSAGSIAQSLQDRASRKRLEEARKKQSGRVDEYGRSIVEE